MNILIVEDELRLSEALAQIMREQKYNVDVVNDGEDGLAYALSNQYDVIVLDIMLPKRDGFSVAREARKAGVATPILMLTARDEITDKVSGLDCGADDYMTKPFSSVELLARVRALSRRKGEVVTEYGLGLSVPIVFTYARPEYLCADKCADAADHMHRR